VVALYMQQNNYAIFSEHIMHIAHHISTTVGMVS